MPVRRNLTFAATLLLAAALVGCGGGGGAAPPTSTPVLAQQPLVMEYDHNNDDVVDWVTVDTSVTPFRILEVLEGRAGGDPVDMTAFFKGQVIDMSLSEALANHLAVSVSVAERTEVEIQNSSGVPVRVALFR